MAITQSQRLYHFTRITHSNHTSRNILGNNRACTYGRTFANRNTRKHRNITAKPNIVSNRYRLGTFNILITHFWVKRMNCRIKTTVRANINMIAKNHLGLIQNYKVIIGKKEITNLNVLSIITKERSIDMQFFPRLGQ